MTHSISNGLATTEYDVIIIGAGAAGLMCAAQAAQRGRTVLVVDHGKKPGRKILISGGGRCNFTNYHISAEHYLSHNPHFVKSALAQYTNWDFIELVQRHGIEYEEKEQGQLFCHDSAKAIVQLLVQEAQQVGVNFLYQLTISTVQKSKKGFVLSTPQAQLSCSSLVVATGGLSMPKLGATPLGYQIAEQFGLKVQPTRAGLVPFTLHVAEKERLAELSGLSVNAKIMAENGRSFQGGLLFTHRGLSGPIVLQISSYWQAGERVMIDLCPEFEVYPWLLQQQFEYPQYNMRTILAHICPKRLVDALLNTHFTLDKPLKQYSHAQMKAIADALNHWSLLPNGTEGYRTAEVTLGGVDTRAISSKTMECQSVSGLFFIGEVLDVTGWLGGYNFQWAWSSGYVAGQNV